MKKKTNLIFLLGMFIILISCHTQTKSNNKIYQKIFSKNDHWGYEIYINDKCFIHQEYIPAISGKVPFYTKKDAELVGNLVINKIKHKKTPTVDTGELRQLGIKGTS